MRNQEGETSIHPPLFNGSNLVFWKVRTRAYLQSLGADVWGIIEGGHQYPSSIPTDEVEKKKYETNAKAVNTLLGSLEKSKFVKFSCMTLTNVNYVKLPNRALTTFALVSYFFLSASSVGMEDGY